VLEPFITPAIYQKYPNAIDEWTLHTLMAADPASGGLNQLDGHYNTFIVRSTIFHSFTRSLSRFSRLQTEEDFAQIAGAGLNWVRLPIAFWAIDTWAGEPFLPKVSWKYALKAFDWARKYGIRIMLDIHTAPGSQNGYTFHPWFYCVII
jgi:aryl-phospho-beta-D-glucosidase BglC (GH1 family)